MNGPAYGLNQAKYEPEIGNQNMISMLETFITGCNQNMISLKGPVFINDEKWACLFPRNAHYIIQHDLKIYVCFPFCNTTGKSNTHIIQNNRKMRLIIGSKEDQTLRAMNNAENGSQPVPSMATKCRYYQILKVKENSTKSGKNS